jgi:hypothetical protein
LAIRFRLGLGMNQTGMAEGRRSIYWVLAVTETVLDTQESQLFTIHFKWEHMESIVASAAPLSI